MGSFPKRPDWNEAFSFNPSFSSVIGEKIMSGLPRARLLISMFSVAFFGLTTTNFAQAQSGAVVVGASTTWAKGNYQLTSLTVNGGATLTVGGGSSVTVTGAVQVTGNSNIVLEAANNTGQVNGTWQGTGVTINA